MRPEPGRVLYTIAGELMGQVAPQVATPFGQQTVGLSATMAMILAQELDRAASRLVEENRVLDSLLGAASNVVRDTSLLGEINSAQQATTTDFHVSALQARNDVLRALLIRVHAEVELADSAEAAALNDSIWAELQESTRRRHIASPLG